MVIFGTVELCGTAYGSINKKKKKKTTQHWVRVWYQIDSKLNVESKYDFKLKHEVQPYSAVAQSVERATPGEEVPGSIPAVAARSLLVGSVSV